MLSLRLAQLSQDLYQVAGTQNPAVDMVTVAVDTDQTGFAGVVRLAVDTPDEQGPALEQEGLVEGWRVGLVEGWGVGLVEGWRVGLVEGWGVGLVEGWGVGLVGERAAV